MLKVCYFYSQPFHEAVISLPLDAFYVYTGRNDTDYALNLKEYWDIAKHDLMIVEQDIVVREDIIDQFENCPFAWCVFPYNGLTESLGCTRFRQEAIKNINFLDVPNSLMSWPVEEAHRPLFSWPSPTRNLPCDHCKLYAPCWRHLDVRLAGALKEKGYRVHVHAPDVRHLK